MGVFPLLYQYGDENDPFDMANYLQYKSSTRAAGGSSSKDSNMVKLYNLSWVAHCKRRLNSDSLLLYSAGFFQQCRLRTATNMQDLRLYFLEKEQMQRIGEEGKLQQATL